MGLLSIFGTIFSVIGALRGGQQQQQMYNAQAQAEAYNAAVKRQQADTVQQVYGQREEQQRRNARLLAGKRRAAIAESGTGFGGSNLDIENQSEVMAELDALNIRYEGQLESKGLLDAAALDDYSAGLYRRSGGYARRTGYLAAGSAILSGAADYSRLGGFSSPAPRINSPYSLASGRSSIGLRY